MTIRTAEYTEIPTMLAAIFLAFLGRGPRALWFGNFLGVQQKIGEEIK